MEYSQSTLPNHKIGNRDLGFGAFLTLDPDPGSDIRDPEWVNIRIQDKHPGSAILKRTVTDVPPYPFLPLLSHKKKSTRRRFNTSYSVHVGDILPHTQYCTCMRFFTAYSVGMEYCILKNLPSCFSLLTFTAYSVHVGDFLQHN